MSELTLHTFGDSVLDCARYNPARVTPASLILRNNNTLFPDMRGMDLRTQYHFTYLDHRATDGATVKDLPSQLTDLDEFPKGTHIALVSVGGNDLLRYLYKGDDLSTFRDTYAQFLSGLHAARYSARDNTLPMKVYLLNVYDPSFGDDARNILNMPEYHVAPMSELLRAKHQAMNAEIASLAAEYDATLVDLHSHFLAGDDTWFAHTIEPSARGASEIRKAFIHAYVGR